MKLYISFLLVILFMVNQVCAKGVSAGTVIQNSATLSFSLDAEVFSIKSNVVKNIVHQVIDTKVSWMDTKSVTVSKGEKKRVLTYRVLNNGNGKDRYTLLANEIGHKSEFELKKKKIYLDFNNNFRFDSKDRIRKTLNLNADEEKLIFVVSRIKKDETAPSGSLNYVSLKAISRIGGSGQIGKIYSRKGVNGVDVIDGLTGGVSEDEGTYKLLIANVVLVKDVIIDDNDLITVMVTVAVAGEGSVKDVKVVDDIPNETIYVKDSLSLDGGYLTDQNDGDVGRYKRKYKERKAQVLVSLGELDTSSHHTITYNLKIR